MRGQHHWMKRHAIKTCQWCGVATRSDGANKPCPGKTRPELKENRIRAAAKELMAVAEIVA